MPKNKRKSKTVKIGAPPLTEAAIEKAKALAECARLEALPPHERFLEEAKKRQNRPYADSLMRVTFPSLRAIKHVNGVIMLVADNVAATKQAIIEAEDMLGPAASHEEVLKEAERRKVKTTLMSVQTFKRNLLNVLQLCNGHAEMFGAGSGGGALKDIYKEGVAAIQEAEKYWESQNRILTKEIKEFMNTGIATDERTFAILLGKDWKTDNTLDPETKKLLGFL